MSDMEEHYQAELKCRRRRPNKSLRKLAQDIRHLMMMSYPGDRSTMAKHLAKEYFVSDLEFSYKICPAPGGLSKRCRTTLSGVRNV